MSLNWAVQKDMFPENEKRLEEILGDRLTYFDYRLEGPDCSLEPPFICYGSIQSCRRLQKRGAICWLYDNVFDCNYYLPKLGKFALNNPHLYCEYGTFPLLLSSLNSPDMFVKQNSGYKYFTGDKLCNIRLDEMKLFPEELLLLAPSKEIGAEWRFVISRGKIITYSLYGDILSSANPSGFVEEVLSSTELDPAPIWTMDVCEYDGYRVVEINSLLSAGWYDADVTKIVEEVDKLANELLP